MTYTATIQHVEWTRGSGLATLVVLDSCGDILHLHADAGPLSRALDASGATTGTVIDYDLTDYGTLAAFNLTTNEKGD